MSKVFSTLPNYGNVCITANSVTGSTYTIPYTWNNASVLTVSGAPSPSLQVSGDADIRGNLTVHGTNVTEILARIQERLAILVPDPKLLAQYEALREAYEHYRTLEALCVNTDREKG